MIFRHKATETFIWGIIGGIFVCALASQWLHGQTPWVISVIWAIALVGTFLEVRKIDAENVEYDDELTYKYFDLLDQHLKLEDSFHKKIPKQSVLHTINKSLENKLFSDLEKEFTKKPRLEQ